MSGRTWRGGSALRCLHTTSGNSSTAERLLEAPARSLSAAACLPVQKFCILQPQIILSMFVTSLTQRGKFRFSCRYRKASDGKASQHWRLLCQRLLSKICMSGATVPENQKPSIEKVLFLKQTEAGIKEFHVMESLNSWLCLSERFICSSPSAAVFVRVCLEEMAKFRVTQLYHLLSNCLTFMANAWHFLASLILWLITV